MDKGNSRLFIVKIIHRIINLLFLYLYNIKCIFTRNDIITFKLADGSDFDYPLRTSIGYALFRSDFEKSEVAFLRRTIKPGDIFFDIGANGGIYTIIAGKQVGPEGHVYAFEPIERELNLLKHNIEINNLKNVTVVECAVSNKNGIARFAIAKDGALNSLAILNRLDQKFDCWRTIATITIDDFICKNSITKVDFIKIDVEGAEKLIFDGAKILLASANNIKILFEASDNNSVAFGYTRNQLFEELSEEGFDIYYLGSQNSLVIVDDFKKKLNESIYNFVMFKRQKIAI